MEQTKRFNFFTGFKFVSIGLKEILTDIKIFIYILTPFILGLFFVYYTFYFGYEFLYNYINQQFEGYLTAKLYEQGLLFRMFSWVIKVLIKFLVSVILIYISFVFVQLLSVPFYSLICERILIKRGLYPTGDFNFGIWIRRSISLFLASLIRMFIFFMVGLLIFFISFLPGLQFLLFVYSGLVIALDSLDYTLEIYDISLSRRLYIYMSQIDYFLGMTVLLLPSLMFPGLSLFLVPVAVVGSAVSFADSKGKAEYERFIA